MDAIGPSYKGFRFPVEIISHCVWLYHRFPLSFREVEEMMLEGVVNLSGGLIAFHPWREHLV
jgi:putative transposase